jgi:hypothetical protein
MKIHALLIGSLFHQSLLSLHSFFHVHDMRFMVSRTVLFCFIKPSVKGGCQESEEGRFYRSQVINKRTATSAGKASNNTKLLALSALLLKNAKQYVLTHKKCALYIISSIAFVLGKNYKDVMPKLLIFISVVLEPLVLSLRVCCSAI